MRATLKKIGLAAVMALTVAGTALVTAGAARAQHWHGHGGGGFGPGFVGGLAAGAIIGGGPYYGGGYYGGPYAYGGRTATFNGEFLSTALATGSYDACEFAIELQSRK